MSTVAELGAETGVPGLAPRAGVVTGEVAVTLGAVGEGMVAGDAVNTAARVKAAAEPGQVLTDGATHRLAGSAVGFADAGEHALKGKAEPARLWRATRVLSAVGGAQRVDGLEAPPMLRAERDLARARLASADSAADGAPDAAAAFTAAIASLRERSTPFHLGHGLLDHAQFLLRQGDADTAALAIEEAREIAERLRCQPLLDRATVSVAADPQTTPW